MKNNQIEDQVEVWEEEIELPTYGIGKAEKNPMFLEKRVYQGSSGVVYPYPVIEKIEDEVKMQKYQAVWLENKYIKVMVLPELGGRIQMAYDKIKERHFVYYNHVVKPALVGLTGPWISGGIEFNWPQHHRPSTYLPVDFTIEKEEDGSAIVWVSERERMFHQKGMAGFVLRPNKAVLEIKGVLYNPTSVPQTFLWWANPAVKVNDDYQSVFPTDVHAVFDHGKRAVSKFPIATGTYYKVDYSKGVDISRYKNLPVPTSYMAIKSDYDFVGGYENDTEAGLLHVANHHISPGKKQWTWGDGDFGRAWDRNLTDADGPYIELMTGVFTDNQPDFTWLQPYEEKSFTQYFLPYRELGVVKNASSDLLMNIESEDEGVVLKIFATCLQEGLSILLEQDDEKVLELEKDLSPENVFVESLKDLSFESLSLTIKDRQGKTILTWIQKEPEIEAIPDAAQPALAPEEYATTEELFLTGQHIEQYRHATFDPTLYYKEALRRDVNDIRNNNALGLWLIRKGQFEKAEMYLRTAVKTQTKRNPNPYDGEPLYNLGLALKMQGQMKKAYGAFYKSTWNGAWQDAGFFALAQISVARKDWHTALEEIDKSLIRNWHNHQGRHLKSVILRALGKEKEALSLIEASLKIDAFNFGCLFEKQLLSNTSQNEEELNRMMRGESRNYEELMLDYADAGCWEEAIKVADFALKYGKDTETIILYYKAWFLIQLHKNDEAKLVIEEGEQKFKPGFFANHLDAILALEAVVEIMPTASKAYYMLGNIWYDKRQYSEAVNAWEKSAKLERYPTTLRNLSLAYFNKLNRVEESVALLEEAFSLDTTDGRVLMELDQLYKRLNKPYTVRLAFLKNYQEVAFSRDDVYLEYITLLNQLGNYEEALSLINQRQFHPWEGGEGKVTAQYLLALEEMTKELLEKRQFDLALTTIQKSFVYPHNLGEGKLAGAQENDFNYYKALALNGLGRLDEAAVYLEKATTGNREPSAAVYYNDQKPDKIAYQGLALRELGKEDEALGRFNNLISYGEAHLYDKYQADFFAVSLPDILIWEDDMDKKNKVHCYYLMGLGYLGLKEADKALHFFDLAYDLDNNHQGVQVHRLMADKMKNNNE